jgi:hypothetical protein
VSSSPPSRDHSDLRIDFDSFDLRGRLERLGQEYSHITTLSELEQQLFEAEWDVIKLQAQIEKKALLRQAAQAMCVFSRTVVDCSCAPSDTERRVSDIEVMTDPVEDLEAIREQLCSNSDSAARSCMTEQEMSEISELLEQKSVELEVLNMNNRRLKDDIHRNLARLRLMDPIGDRSGQSQRRIQLMCELSQAKKKRQDRLTRLEEGVARSTAKLNELTAEIGDLEFLIHAQRTELIEKTRGGKASVRELVGMRMSDRSVLDGLVRLSALVRVETAEIEKAISRHCDCFSPENNARIHEKNELLHAHLQQLKTRFRALRAVKEVRSIALTTEDDLKDLQVRIRTLSSAVDVGKMRQSGILAKIEKQIRQLKEASIRVPEPPETYYNAHRALGSPS